MSYLNSVTLVGFVGSDPEQRQAKGNGSKFTVLSVATQRSWKNAEDEWSSKTEWHRIVVFRPRLAERVATTIKKGAHVLVEGCSRQLDLRTTERQRQEVKDLEDYVVVHSRRCRAQARPRRTRAQRTRSRASTGVQRSCALMSSTRRPSDDVGGPFLFLVLNDQSASSIWTSAVSRS